MRRAGISPFALGFIALLAGSVRASGEPTFHGVGDLAGGAITSTALGVSSNGGVVVGGSESAAGAEAFRWTGPGTIQGLGSLDSGADFFSVATGVSSNGSVIVGTTADGNSRAFRWTSGGGMVGLARFSCLGCDNHAVGNGVSGNGLVAVGSGADQGFTPFIEAARWPSGGTSISALGHLSGGGDASVAYAASNDGAVIVGESDSSSGTRAFAWRTSGGMLALPNVPGAQVRSQALGISSNASTIVGAANTSPSSMADLEAARWTGTNWGTLTLLGSLPGATADFSHARAATSDGAIIVGVATNVDGETVAFIWDSAHGMRDLRELLITDYGLPLEDWTLTEARDISDVSAGAYTIVGAGVNPAGNPEGWVAFVQPVACSDGADNDADLAVDFPADGGCLRRSDPSEQLDCADGLDNDDDGDVDGADDDCTGSGDASEVPDCGDGFDNDGDGQIDLADAGCRDAAGAIENPACDDGLDNDSDGAIDFPADLRCNAADDKSEIADCNDGLDNDGDGASDLIDADCTAAADPAEDPQCSDRVDNDGDLRRDFPDEYPDCASPADTLEKAQCNDGLDNDGDGNTDLADAQCVNPGFATEKPGVLTLGDLVVVDTHSAQVFGLDPDTGVQTLLASGQHLSAPQGVGLRAEGEIVVADPNGLVQLDPVYGTQRLASGALDAFDTLQVVFNAAGDAIVIERDRLSVVDWLFVGQGMQATLLSIPHPNLGAFVGFSLAREASGNLLVTGLGIPNNGIHRVNATTAAVSPVTLGFNSYVFTDLAVEASGSILAVGDNGPAVGLFRVNAATGALTVLNSDASWVTPTAVAVDAAGSIYAADAGTCGGSGCTGAKISKFHPTSGARLATWTGPLLQGPMDIEAVRVLPACRNGLDDDAAGGSDFPADIHCAAPSHVSEQPACDDDLDNDGDGASDLADAGCNVATARKENPQCSDGADNDNDLKADFDGAGLTVPDAQCFNQPYRDKEKAGGCGIGFELALLLPLLEARRRRAASA